MMLGLEIKRSLSTFSISKIRALLEGKFMARVANTGISSIIDLNGNVKSKLGLGKKGIIEEKLVLYKNNTLYNYFGDSIFFIFLLMLTLILIIINFKNDLRKKYERK